MGISVAVMYSGTLDVRDALAESFVSSKSQAEIIESATKQCPTNLISLQPRMERALQFIKSSSFRNTMLASLQAAIPEVIIRADGLAQQILFLKQEIVRQEQERAHAEKVAREGLTDPSQELKPCRHGKESAYCYAMEQFLVSTAANLANHAFLAVLECYQREGVR